MPFATLALDSGAFSASRQGDPICLQSYIAIAKVIRDSNPKVREIFNLDVIGDHEQSRVNQEMMIGQGIDPIPVFHHGSPWHVLSEMLARFPKVALGGVARMRGTTRMRWLDKCFALGWPCLYHGLGVSDETTLMRVPFHSVDTAAYTLGPGFGRWKQFGGAYVPARGVHRWEGEIKAWLELQNRVRDRWATTWSAWNR